MQRNKKKTSNSGKIIVYLNDPRLIAGDVDIVIDSIIGRSIQTFLEDFEGNLFRHEMLTFHKTQDITVLNNMVRVEPLLYNDENFEKADELLENIYEEKYKLERDKLIAMREACLVRTAVYSTPEVLAFAHSIVTTYPELIPAVENPMYIQRAFNFITGSYIYLLNRAIEPPVVTLRYRNTEGIDDLRDGLLAWVENCTRVAKILAAQYGVTCDEKYLALMDSMYIFKDNKFNREIINHCITSRDKYQIPPQLKCLIILSDTASGYAKQMLIDKLDASMQKKKCE